jgi:hypothetical protein
MLPHSPGPALPANTPINVMSSSAGYVREDNATSPAYMGSGSGLSPAEQFVAISPSAPNSIAPIQPGQTTILQSVATGQYCRLVTLSPSTEQGMVCDQPTAATATLLTYTGSGLSYAGVPLVASSSGAPLVLANSTSASLGPSSDDLAFPTAGPPLPANTPLSISTGNGSYVRTDNATGAAYAGAGSGTTAPETFTAVDPADPNSISPILAGEAAVLQSAQTGMYCRLAVLSPGSERGMVCDQPTLAGATPLTYTGSGLSYQGVPLVSTAPGAPLVLANSTTAPLTTSSDNLAFAPTGAVHSGG